MFDKNKLKTVMSSFVVLATVGGAFCATPAKKIATSASQKKATTMRAVPYATQKTDASMDGANRTMAAKKNVGEKNGRVWQAVQDWAIVGIGAVTTIATGWFLYYTFKNGRIPFLGSSTADRGTSAMKAIYDRFSAKGVDVNIIRKVVREASAAGELTVKQTEALVAAGLSPDDVHDLGVASLAVFSATQDAQVDFIWRKHKMAGTACGKELKRILSTGTVDPSVSEEVKNECKADVGTARALAHLTNFSKNRTETFGNSWKKAYDKSSDDLVGRLNREVLIHWNETIAPFNFSRAFAKRNVTLVANGTTGEWQLPPPAAAPAQNGTTGS